jgi:hypothetical protein
MVDPNKAVTINYGPGPSNDPNLAVVVGWPASDSNIEIQANVSWPFYPPVDVTVRITVAGTPLVYNIRGVRFNGQKYVIKSDQLSGFAKYLVCRMEWLYRRKGTASDQRFTNTEVANATLELTPRVNQPGAVSKAYKVGGGSLQINFAMVIPQESDPEPPPQANSGSGGAVVIQTFAANEPGYDTSGKSEPPPQDHAEPIEEPTHALCPIPTVGDYIADSDSYVCPACGASMDDPSTLVCTASQPEWNPVVVSDPGYASQSLTFPPGGRVPLSGAGSRCPLPVGPSLWSR